MENITDLQNGQDNNAQKQANPSAPQDVKGNNGKSPGKPEKLHIFINNIKYSEDDGVRKTMTGKELADLVPVPAENSDITRKNSDLKIGADESIQIKMADHFEIIRRRVEAGF